MKFRSRDPVWLVLTGFVVAALTGSDLDGWNGAKVATGIFTVVCLIGFLLIDYAQSRN